MTMHCQEINFKPLKWPRLRNHVESEEWQTASILCSPLPPKLFNEFSVSYSATGWRNLRLLRCGAWERSLLASSTRAVVGSRLKIRRKTRRDPARQLTPVQKWAKLTLEHCRGSASVPHIDAIHLILARSKLYLKNDPFYRLDAKSVASDDSRSIIDTKTSKPVEITLLSENFCFLNYPNYRDVFTRYLYISMRNYK